MLCSAASYHKSVSFGRKPMAVCYNMGPRPPISMYERCTEWCLLMNGKTSSETLFESDQNLFLQPFYLLKILFSIHMHTLCHLCVSHELILRIFVIPPAYLVAIRFVCSSWPFLLLRWIVFSARLSPFCFVGNWLYTPLISFHQGFHRHGRCPWSQTWSRIFY